MARALFPRAVKRRLAGEEKVKSMSVSASRPGSRLSSRSSFRSHSPAVSIDDTVHVRGQISSLRHTIRHQQAQLHSLENIIRSGPRPYPPEISSDSMAQDDLASPPSSFSSFSTPRASKRRSSHEILAGIAGPESNLPLPKRIDDSADSFNGNDVIREGIPLHFGSPPSSMASKRPSSPTRSLSRIPVSAVGNARALADDGLLTPTSPPRPPINKSHSSADLSMSSTITASSAIGGDSALAPPSPTLNGSFSGLNLSPSTAQSRRVSFTPAGTTKVLADLQAGVINARHALENTKSQLRLSQRTVASLTRKVEDLKEVEDRLRLENEGLNNVVARKERLLQEVLERARKAEAEAATLKQQLKTETTASKKNQRDLEQQLTESTALSKKSEREYVTLRDSLKSLTESWKQDAETLKSDMRKREEKWKKEVDGVGKKYRDLCANVKEREKIWVGEFKTAREEDMKAKGGAEVFWLGQIEKMQEVVEKNGKQCEKAEQTARDLARELTILRKRMRSGMAPADNENGLQQPATNASDNAQNVPP